MLAFRVCQIRLEGIGRCYLPLPKLSEEQVSLIKRHLEERGFSVRRRRHLLHAVSRASNLTVDPAGLSWSSEELIDPIGPVIPSLLEVPKQRVEIDSLGARYLYFVIKRRGLKLEIQLFTRMESLRLWSELRKAGLCGLTPDERTVIASLLGSHRGTVDCVTDYYTDVCIPMQIGRNLYYQSTLPISEFVSSLRTFSEASKRNSYVPRDSILRLTADDPIDAAAALQGLGQWCYLDFASTNL